MATHRIQLFDDSPGPSADDLLSIRNTRLRLILTPIVWAAGFLLPKFMDLSKIDTRSAVDIMLVIGHTHLKRGRLDAGRLLICGPATSWDTYCGGTQFGNFLFATLKREFLSSIIIYHFCTGFLWYLGLQLVSERYLVNQVQEE